ncbi:hypothetical protein HMPREF1090_05683, partial [[Clostridium] clostridioforme 90A8]
LHIKTCEAIVLIDCHNLPSLLFAVFFQHITLERDLSRAFYPTMVFSF